jgi:hypothetical protein
MPAPKGNKNAVGNSGRPPERDVQEWVKALDDWSQKEEATALCQFCVEQNTYADKVYELRNRYVEFSDALKKAKIRLAQRLRAKLHDKENPYNYGLFMRDIPCHDQFVRDHEREEKEEELERKKRLIDHEVKSKSALPQLSPEQLDSMRILNEQLIALQEAKKNK